MNAIAPEQAVLTAFAAALTAAYPGRVVTRDLKDFADRTKAELTAGVFTVIANGQPAGDAYAQKLKFLVVGQIEFPERTAGHVVEDAELAMSREVKNLLQRQLLGPDLRILGVDQSSQLEVPYGWVSISIEVGPYDGTEPLTEDEVIGALAEFLTFRADIDIGQPHQSAVEHAKWADDPPDYTTSKPDIQTHNTLPRSEP
jgi:hypothetical protein